MNDARVAGSRPDKDRRRDGNHRPHKDGRSGGDSRPRVRVRPEQTGLRELKQQAGLHRRIIMQTKSETN